LLPEPVVRVGLLSNTKLILEELAFHQFTFLAKQGLCNILKKRQPKNTKESYRELESDLFMAVYLGVQKYTTEKKKCSIGTEICFK